MMIDAVGVIRAIVREQLRGFKTAELAVVTKDYAHGGASDSDYYQCDVRLRDEKKRMIEITSKTAVWFHNGQPPLPICWVVVRDPKKIFKTQALLCTDLSISPDQIVQWFVRRWQVEVTFHAVRTHLGVETQRQWADLSILRITPALLGLFSIVTLLANCHARKQKLPVQQTAWYQKKLPSRSPMRWLS